MDLLTHLESARGVDGRLTPQSVVDAARPDDHPLHHRFEWDDAVAGEAYRRDQARELLRIVRRPFPTEDDPNRTIRALIAVPYEESTARTYEPVEKVMGDTLQSHLVLQEMAREWHTFRSKWEHLAEFSDYIRGHLPPEDE